MHTHPTNTMHARAGKQTEKCPQEVMQIIHNDIQGISKILHDPAQVFLVFSLVTKRDRNEKIRKKSPSNRAIFSQHPVYIMNEKSVQLILTFYN